MTSQTPVYLDYAATTPLDPVVFEAMRPFFWEHFGNPSGAHQVSRKATAAVARSRKVIADHLGVLPSELIFTGGGSESDNLAIRGVAFRGLTEGKGNHIVLSGAEHQAVRETVHHLCCYFGFTQTVVPLDSEGVIDIEALEKALTPQTILVSVILGSNEVGTLQPIEAIARLTKARQIPFHTDAVQAVGACDIRPNQLGVDLMALSSHKIYGPKGVGLLYCRKEVDLQPQITGGSQEWQRRAGTENVPGIVGFATALEEMLAGHDRLERERQLQNQLINGVLERIPGAQLTGSRQHRLPGHCSFLFPSIPSDKLLMHLDLAGFCASSGSACATGNPAPSTVLLAMGISPEDAMTAVRFTIGRFTTEAEIQQLLQFLPPLIQKLGRL